MTVYLEVRRYVGQHLGDSLADRRSSDPPQVLHTPGGRVHDVVAWKLGGSLTALLLLGQGVPSAEIC